MNSASVKHLPCSEAVTIGCDPEVFITREVGRVRKRKAVVGSEVVIPPDGIPYYYLDGGVNGVYKKKDYERGSIVRDGVQVELHPIASHCRANLSNYLQQAFQTLNKAVQERSKELGMELKVDFSQTVRLSKGDLAKLSADSKILGCMPSLNIYGRPHIERDGTKYLLRSGAGHIHIGSDALTSKKTVDPVRLVRVCEVLIGNTCVLIDRNPAAIQRRKLYGRAGEYRLPKWGLEYRTLSNFWLHNYKLMSLVTGLAKMAFHIAATEATKRQYEASRHMAYYPANTYAYDAEERLLKNVDWRRIETAINTNDFDLAWKNYEEYTRPFLNVIASENGLQSTTVPDFEFFVQKIRDAEMTGVANPLTVWFPEDPLQHWISKPEGHGTGWESWLSSHVRMKRMATLKVSGLVQVPQPAEIAPPTPVTPVAEPAILGNKEPVGARLTN